MTSESEKNTATVHSGKVIKVKSSSKEMPLQEEVFYDRDMSWWPELSDLDRLNVMASPIEDRVRILTSIISGTVEETMLAISERTNLSYLHDFTIAEFPTKLIPLRLIHSFSCLPISTPTLLAIKEPKVLVVDEDKSVHQEIGQHLGAGFKGVFVSEVQKAIDILRDVDGFSTIFVSSTIAFNNAFSLLNEVKVLQPSAKVFLLGHSLREDGTENPQASKDAVESGLAIKVLTKPLDSMDLQFAFPPRIEGGNGKPAVFSNGQGKIDLLAVWPPSPRMSRWVYAVSGFKPVWHLGSPEEVVRAITENFGIGADSLDESDIDHEAEQEAQDDLEDQNAAIIRFVNEVVQRAIVDRATDIHFEPHKETLQIRYRIDGQLVPVRVPDNLRSFQDAIISRIKIMAGINISEKRRPQGGRITFTHGQSDLDIRVSTLPTLYGESISLRLLNEKSQPLSMRELGLVSSEEKKLVAILEKPHGIVLVTGPTGSGKSTSLTAFIRKIHKPERRIMTVEDPVEYEVSGINQTQVNSEIGFTFSSALREILRQDPDVIMVGEIRDRETADIAIRASLTGHLVLSTLHTNDAPGAITRLIDMEIEPFLIASSVEMVMAQRLVRRLCGNCAEASKISEEDLRATLSLLEVDTSEVIHLEKVLSANGCTECQNLGYRGRVGIFELMRMSDELHGLIINSASAPEIRLVAMSEGMSSLQSSGWAQVKRGLTSLEEVVRYADIFVDEVDVQADS
jgi:general secretion pathway protein E